MSIRGRFSSIETRPNCGTYAAFYFALRERDAGRENCGPCASCRDAKRKYDNAKYPTRKHRQREVHQIKKYGITFDEKEAVFVAQGRRCAICRSDDPKTPLGWSTEHDHATGDVRGVTCPHCNHMIGNAAKAAGTEDPNRLTHLLGPAAIDYLRNGAERTRRVVEQFREAANAGPVQ